MKRKNIAVYVAKLCITLLLTSCSGFDANDVSYDYDFFSPFREGEHILVVDINVANYAFFGLPDMLKATVQRFENRMASEGICVTVDIRSFVDRRLPGEMPEETHVRRNVEFMTGRGADLIIFEGQPLFSFSRSGLLADIWRLIDRDASVGREDFHENVLHAFEVDGRLVTMPFQFTVPHIAINNRLPYSLVGRFNEMETITLTDMMRLYNELVYNYPQYGHLMLANDMEIELAILYELASHVDLPNGAVNFDSTRFAYFLELAKPSLVRAKPILMHTTLYLGGERHPTMRYIGSVGLDVRYPHLIFTTEQLIRFSEETVFLHLHSSLQQAVALLPLQVDCFVGVGPLVLECGRHILDSRLHDRNRKTFTSHFIREGNNSVLAWEFLKELIEYYDSRKDPVFRNYGMNTLAMPIVRRLNEERTKKFLMALFDPGNKVFGRDQVIRNFGNLILHAQTSPFKREDCEARIAEYVQAAMDRLNHIAEQPMAAVPFIPVDFFMDEVMLFLNGVILAQEAANRIGNRLTLWMMEH